MTAIARRIDGWWMAPAPAERLAMLRLLVGAFAVGYVALRVEHLANLTDFRSSQFEPVGVVALLDGPLPDGLVRILPAATILAGLGFVAGWRFSLSGPVFAALLLWTLSYRNSWGQIFHTENLLVLHTMVLAVSPAADALSLDARAGRATPRDAARYGWPIRLMCCVTVVTYFIGGVAKLKDAGIDWVTDDALRRHVAYDNLRKIELGDAHSPLGAALVEHGWLFRPLASLTMAIELGAPLALLSRASARLWTLGAWSFHAGVFALMAILFPYPLLGVAYAPFFEVERALGWLPASRRAGERAPSL